MSMNKNYRLRIFLRSGKMLAGLTESSSMPMRTNSFVRLKSAPSSPQTPHQMPAACAPCTVISIRRKIAGWCASKNGSNRWFWRSIAKVY